MQSQTAHATHSTGRWNMVVATFAWKTLCPRLATWDFTVKWLSSQILNLANINDSIISDCMLVSLEILHDSVSPGNFPLIYDIVG